MFKLTIQWHYSASQTFLCMPVPGDLVEMQIMTQWTWNGGLRLCISNKLLGDVEAAGSASTL